MIEKGHTRGGIVFRCPHKDMKHYAKGMCNKCYHLYGRTRLADKCIHTDRLIYAKGLCLSCYYTKYVRNKYAKTKLNKLQHAK